MAGLVEGAAADRARVAGAAEFLRGRLRWRHLLVAGVGGVLLFVGAATIGLRLLGRTGPGLPGLGAGAACYLSGCCLFAWGAARGWTARLVRWLPGTLVGGLLVVPASLVLLWLQSDLRSHGHDLFETGSSGGPASGPSAPPPGRHLASLLLPPAVAAELLGPGFSGPLPMLPGLMRTRSVARWTSPEAGTVTVVAGHLPRAAARARRSPPRGAIPRPGLVDGGWVWITGSGRFARACATRGPWLVMVRQHGAERAAAVARQSGAESGPGTQSGAGWGPGVRSGAGWGPGAQPYHTGPGAQPYHTGPGAAWQPNAARPGADPILVERVAATAAGLLG